MSSETFIIERFSPLREASPIKKRNGHRRSGRRGRSKTKMSQSQTRELGHQSKDHSTRQRCNRHKNNNLKESRRDIFLPHPVEQVTVEMDSDAKVKVVGDNRIDDSSRTTPVAGILANVTNSGMTYAACPLNSECLFPVDSEVAALHNGGILATNSTALMRQSQLQCTENKDQLTDGGAALKLKLSDLLWTSAKATQTPHGKHFHMVLTKVCQGAVAFVDSIIQCQNISITPHPTNSYTTQRQRSMQNTQFRDVVTEVIQCINMLASTVPSDKHIDEQDPLESKDGVEDQWYQDPVKFIRLSGLAPTYCTTSQHQDENSCFPAVHGNNAYDNDLFDSMRANDSYVQDINVGMEVVVSSTNDTLTPSDLVQGSNIPVISDVYSLLGDNVSQVGDAGTNRSESLGCQYSNESISAQTSYTSRYSSHISSPSITDSQQNVQLRSDHQKSLTYTDSSSITTQDTQPSDHCFIQDSRQHESLQPRQSREAAATPHHVLLPSSCVASCVRSSSSLHSDQISISKTDIDSVNVDCSESGKVCIASYHVVSSMAGIPSFPGTSITVGASIPGPPTSDVTSASCSLNSNSHITTKSYTTQRQVNAMNICTTTWSGQQPHKNKMPDYSEKDLAIMHDQVDNRPSNSVHVGFDVDAMDSITNPANSIHLGLKVPADKCRQKGRPSRHTNGGCKKKTKCVGSQTPTKEENIKKLVTDLKNKLRKTKVGNNHILTRSTSRKRASYLVDSRKRERSMRDEQHCFAKKIKVDSVLQNIMIRSPIESDTSNDQRTVDRDEKIGVPDALSDIQSQVVTNKCDVAVQSTEKRDVSMQTDLVFDGREVYATSTTESNTSVNSRLSIKQELKEEIHFGESTGPLAVSSLLVRHPATHGLREGLEHSVRSKNCKYLSVATAKRSKFVKSMKKPERSKQAISTNGEDSSSGTSIAGPDTNRSMVPVEQNRSVTPNSVKSLTIEASTGAEGTVSSRLSDPIVSRQGNVLEASKLEQATNAVEQRTPLKPNDDKISISSASGRVSTLNTNNTMVTSVSKENKPNSPAEIKNTRINRFQVVSYSMQNPYSDSSSTDVSDEHKEQRSVLLFNPVGIFTPETSSSEMSIRTGDFCKCTDEESSEAELSLPAGRQTRNSLNVTNWCGNFLNHKSKLNSRRTDGKTRYATEPRSRRNRSSIVKSPQDEVIGDFHKRGFQYTKECFAILDSVYNIPAAYPFRPEVTSKEDPEYHKVVKFPMCLDTMTYRVRQRLYINLNDVIKDIRRIFWNCRLYYPEGCQVRKDCDILEKTMEEKISKTFPHMDFTAITGSPPIRQFKKTSRKRVRSSDKKSPPLLSKHGKLPRELRHLFG